MVLIFFQKSKPMRGNVKVELNISNYAAKADLKKSNQR